MQFQIPSKTFLIGEYLALKGGDAIVATTTPMFRMEVLPGSGKIKSFHLESPAGKLFRDYEKQLTGFDFTFHDAHGGLGGFGASTAQFLGVFQKLVELELLAENDLHSIYLKYSWDGEGFAPSGADLMAQKNGGITYFSRKHKVLSRLTWGFQDLELVIFPTGKKLATHEHLKSLVGFSEHEMEKAMALACLAFEKQDPELLVESFSKYSAELSKLGFVADHTLELLHDLAWVPGVYAAKGCGAMGADVVAALINPQSLKEFQVFLAGKNLGPFWTTKSLASGARWV